MLPVPTANNLFGLSMIRLVAVAMALSAIGPLHAQSPVRTIADVRTAAGHYWIEVDADGKVVLSAAAGARRVGCWMRPDTAESWSAAQRAVLDSTLTSRGGEPLTLGNTGSEGDYCHAMIERLVRMVGNTLTLRIEDKYYKTKSSVDLTRPQADALLASVLFAAKVAREADATGRQGHQSAKAIARNDAPLVEPNAGKPGQQVPGTGPLHYPEALRSASVEGVVHAQFVVDADGRYQEGTFKVIKSSHELFTQAVKDALPDMRFYAADVGGMKVKQFVQKTFTFSLADSAHPASQPRP